MHYIIAHLYGGTVLQVLYALALVPVGFLADRADRPRLLSGGLAAWSLLTMAASKARHRSIWGVIWGLLRWHVRALDGSDVLAMQRCICRTVPDTVCMQVRRSLHASAKEAS